MDIKYQPIIISSHPTQQLILTGMSLELQQQQTVNFMLSNSDYLGCLLINLFQMQLQESKTTRDWINFAFNFTSSSFKLFGQKCARDIQRIIRMQMITNFTEEGREQPPITQYRSLMKQQSEYTLSLAQLMNYLCLLFVRMKVSMPLQLGMIVSKVKSAQLTLMFTTGECISEIIIENVKDLEFVSGEGWEKVREIATNTKLDKLTQWADHKIREIKKYFEIENIKEKERIFEEEKKKGEGEGKIRNSVSFQVVERKLKKRTIKKTVRTETKEGEKNQAIKSIPSIPSIQGIQIQTPLPRKSLPRTLFHTNKHTFKSSQKRQASPEIVYVFDEQQTGEQHRTREGQDDFSQNLSKLRMKTPPRKDKKMNLPQSQYLAQQTPPKATRRNRG